MEFFNQNKEIIFVGLGIIIGAFLPLAKTHFIGKKVGQKIPKKLAIIIANHLDAFEKGLRDENFNGNKNIISNDQLTEKKEKLMLDLGLEQKSKEKDLK